MPTVGLLPSECALRAPMPSEARADGEPGDLSSALSRAVFLIFAGMRAVTFDSVFGDHLDTVQWPDYPPSNTSSLRGIAFVSGSIWDRANRVTQACHLKRAASKTRPPNWPYRRFYRSPLSMPLDTSVGDPSRVAKVSVRKVAGQIGGLRLPRSNRGQSSFSKCTIIL